MRSLAVRRPERTPNRKRRERRFPSGGVHRIFSAAVDEGATMRNILKLAVALTAGVLCVSCGPRRGDGSKPSVIFSGGHDTDPQDKGRPVVLIAAALDVKPE